MKLFDLGTTPWKQTQLVYHALPRCKEEALVIHSPKEPYVCIGYHQELSEEIDLDYCKRKNIPVFRREVGGGVVYLDQNQLFYHLIIRRDNPLAPVSKEVFYRKFLQAPIEMCKELGIDAEYKPINEIVASGKRISGNGGGEIDGSSVLAGSILLDFDYEAMSKVLKVPSEEFRDKVYESMKENITTVKKELGHTPPRERIGSILISKFEDVLGPLEKEELNEENFVTMKELDKKFSSHEWLHRNRRRKCDVRKVKIAEGVWIIQNQNKKGIKATIEVKDGNIRDVMLSGIRQKDELENALIGVKMEEKEILNIVERFYDSEAEELAKVILGDDYAQSR